MLSEEQQREPAAKWWPGRTSAIISAVLVALACPFLAYATFAFLIVLLTQIPAHKPGEARNEDVGLGIALAYFVGVIALTFGGLLVIGAAGLFLRPGFRGRVMAYIAGLIILLPVAAALALSLK